MSNDRPNRPGLLRRHRLRNADIPFWWHLPDDPSRIRSPWHQLVRDLAMPAPFSVWHEQVAINRVRRYDRLRPYACRGFLVAVMAGCLVALQSGWPLLALLAPSAVQVILELHLHRYVVSDEAAPTKLAQWMTDLQQAHFETALANATGLIGVAAVPLNVVAVSLAPPGQDLGWLKVMALAAAVLYCTSALRNTFLDPPNFTEISKMPQIMHAVRPHASFIAVAVIAGIVAFGHHLGRWEPAVLPLAYLTCGLALLLGGTIRDNDRLLWAAVPTAREAIVAGRQNLGQVMHDDLGAMKAAALEAAACAELPIEHRLELQSLDVFLTGFSTRIGLDHADPMDLESLAVKVVSRYGILPRHITVENLLARASLGREDHRVALKVLTALLHNAGQALMREPAQRRTLTVRAWHTGDDSNRVYHVAVEDLLPVIADDRWLRPGSTLQALDEWLAESYGGAIQQYPVDSGKSIEAQWFDRQVTTIIEPMESW